MDEYLNFAEDLKAYFLDPHRKTYYLYLLSSLGIGLMYLFFAYKKTSFQERCKKLLFNREHWIGASPMCDYSLLLINSFFRVFLIVPFLMTGVELSFAFAKWLMLHFDSPPLYEGGRLKIMLFYTLTLWLLSDFSRFFLHYLAHRITFLWEFHKVHHSATVLNPLTLFRQHPLEMFLFHIRGTFVFALVTGWFYFYYPYSFGLIEVLGVNIGRFIFLFLGANLRHSHIPISYGRFLEHIFISPLQHQIHHSVEKRDHHKNMGSHLALWDWLFGTLKVADKNKKEYEFGLPIEGGEDYNSLFQALFLPIKKIFVRKKQ